MIAPVHGKLYLSLSRKFWRSVPERLALTITFKVFSQFLLLVSFFLPLKVLILLSSEDIPAYLASWGDLIGGKFALIVTLSLISLAAYILQLFFGNAADRNADVISRVMLARNKRLFLQYSDYDFSLDIFYRYSKSISSLVFYFFGVVATFWLDIRYFSFLIFLLVIIWPICVWAWINRRKKIVLEEKKLIKLRNDYIKQIFSLSFFAFFVFIISLFYFFGVVEPVSTLISILLCRIIFQNATSFVLDACYFEDNRPRIYRLFYVDNAKVKDIESVRADVEPIFSSVKISGLVGECIKAFSLLADDYEWLDSRSAINEAVIAVKSISDPIVYIIKVYPSFALQIFNYEKAIFGGMSGASFLFPHYIGDGSYESYNYIIFSMPGFRLVDSSEEKVLADKAKFQMLSTRLPNEIVSLCDHNKRMLWEFYNDQMVDAVRVACKNDEEALLLDEFKSTIPDIQQRLRCQPLYLHNFEVNALNLLADEQCRPFLLSWSRWAILPIGAGLNLDYVSDSELEDMVKDVSILRADCEGLTSLDIKFNILAYKINFSVSRQNYQMALGQIKELINLNNYLSNFTGFYGGSSDGKNLRG